VTLPEWITTSSREAIFDTNTILAPDLNSDIEMDFFSKPIPENSMELS
jgi:hypothetical protein